MLFYFALLYTVYFAQGKIMNYNNAVDLGFAHDEDTLFWFANITFQVVSSMVLETPEGWVAAKTFQSPEHGGTHLDAPYHFYKKGWQLSDMTLDQSFAEGVIIDVQDQVKQNPDFLLQPEDIQKWENANGPFPSRCILLVNFGWASKYPNRKSFFGNENLPFQFPGISKAAAEYIVKTGKVIGVGVDTFSVDGGKYAPTAVAHRVFAEANIFILEIVALNNTALPSKGFNLVVLPFKMTHGTGGPVRIVALY